MVWLLTWTTYGTWLPGGRGRLDIDPAVAPIEPKQRAGDERLKWPPVTLDPDRRRLVARDLKRIAELRGFVVHLLLVAEDHVHLILSNAEAGLSNRLVQLIKGSLSRTLSKHSGDEPAPDHRGHQLRHQKWWSRQYAVQRVDDDRAYRRLVDRLRARHAEDVEPIEVDGPPATAARPPQD